MDQNPDDDESEMQVGNVTTNLNTVVLLEDPRERWFVCHGVAGQPSVYARGYAFLQDRDYVEGQCLADHILSNCRGTQREAFAKLRQLIPAMNGSWALVVKYSDGSVLAATDRSRSVPIIYASVPGQMLVSSTPEPILQRLGRILVREEAAAELLLSGYISDKDTLYEGIEKVQPSEIIECSTETCGAVVHHNYFRYFPDSSCQMSEQSLREELEDVLEHVFARFARAFKGKRIVLPLSGGYDSRLIGWMLYKNGVRDVVCYTYGEKGNAQASIAERVAQSLGFPWRFIEYSAARWAMCMEDSRMVEYWRYAFRGMALPHLQDFPAFLVIMDNVTCGDPVIVLPGHVADAWASEFVLRSFDQCALHPLCECHSDYSVIAEDPITSAIVYRHLNLWPVSSHQWATEPWISVARKIRSSVTSYGHRSDDGIWNYVEWVLRNRTAIWILRTFRCAEFFGGEGRLCLGDYDIIDFFRKLPMDLLYLRRLYAETLREHIFSRPDCPLRDIPVMSGASREKSPRRAVFEMMKKLGVYAPYEWTRRVLRPRRISAADTWFSQGRAAHKMRVREVLEPYDVCRHLPEHLSDIVTPYLRYPAYAIQCNGLLAAIMLAREYERMK